MANSALIYDGGAFARRPVLLVAPNWLGMREESIERVKRMAGSKYVALLVDMYGEGKKASDPAETPYRRHEAAHWHDPSDFATKTQDKIAARATPS